MLRPVGGGMLLALVGLLAPGCAPRSQYMGLDLRPASAIAPDVRRLAQKAQAGDKQAQLELGIAFEEGNLGLPRDTKRAAKLFAAAAMDKGGTRTAFIPNNGAVSAMTQYAGPFQPGLREARERLMIGSQFKNSWKILAEKISRELNKNPILSEKIYNIEWGVCDELKTKNASEVISLTTQKLRPVPPISCVFPDRLSEFAYLANNKNKTAEITLLSLYFAIPKYTCDHDRFFHTFRKISEEGNGAVSFMLGYIYLECKSPRLASEAFRRSMSQGYFKPEQLPHPVPNLVPKSEDLRPEKGHLHSDKEGR